VCNIKEFAQTIVKSNLKILKMCLIARKRLFCVTVIIIKSLWYRTEMLYVDLYIVPIYLEAE